MSLASNAVRQISTATKLTGCSSKTEWTLKPQCPVVSYKLPEAYFFDQMHPVVKNHFWMLTGNDRTLRSSVRSLHSSMSGNYMTVRIRRSVFKERGHVACIARLDAEVQRPINMTGASGHLMLCPVKGYNGSISWGLLFKPHGRL